MGMTIRGDTTDLIRTAKAITSAAQRLGSLRAMMLNADYIVTELYRVLDALDDIPYATEAMITRARREYGSAHTVIESDALMSHDEGGYWIEAWVWIEQE